MLSGFSHVQLFVTLWTIAHETPLSMVFSRQEYWSRLPYPPPRNLPDPGIKPTSESPVLHVNSSLVEPPVKLLSISAAARSLKSCQTLCDPTDSSPPGSPVPGILQARTLERVAISFSNV